MRSWVICLLRVVSSRPFILKRVMNLGCDPGGLLSLMAVMPVRCIYSLSSCVVSATVALVFVVVHLSHVMTTEHALFGHARTSHPHPFMMPLAYSNRELGGLKAGRGLLVLMIVAAISMFRPCRRVCAWTRRNHLSFMGWSSISPPHSADFVYLSRDLT